MQTSNRDSRVRQYWIVSWYYNDKLYTETFSSLLQAQLKYWKLGDNNSKSISVKEVY